MLFKTTPSIFRAWQPGLAVILVIYVGLTVYQINLPGLHYDEAFEAVPAMQLLLGQPVTAFRDSGLQIGNQLYPLMTQDYIGALNLYGALPFIAAFGSTPTALRAMSILTGAITVVLTFMLAYRLTGNRWAGLLAALLLAVEPTFIFWNRQGIFVTAVTATIGVGATWCWLRRMQGGAIWWSVGGAFLFGAGLYAKFLFIWLIAALVSAVILLNLSWLFKHRSQFIQWIKQFVFPEGVGVLLAFLIGCWPLLLYNFQTGGTFLNITQNASTSYYGVDNLAFGANLLTRLGQFITLLNGGHFWYLGQVISNPVAPITFGIIAIIAAAVAAIQSIFFSSQVGRPKLQTKVVLFPFLVIGLVILASNGTVSALWITHFAILMPWPALAVATGSWFILENIPSVMAQLRTPGKIIVWGSVCLLVLTNFLAVVNYHRVLTESGGLSAHSDAIYKLSDWLDTRAGRQVAAMDWGLAAPVVYLTYGRVNTVEIFGYRWQADTQLNDRLQNFIDNPDTLYLWRAPDEIIFDRSQEFKALYHPQNKEETIEAAFYEKSGRPVLGVTRLVETGTAANPPK